MAQISVQFLNMSGSLKVTRRETALDKTAINKIPTVAIYIYTSNYSGNTPKFLIYVIASSYICISFEILASHNESLANYTSSIIL